MLILGVTVVLYIDITSENVCMMGVYRGIDGFTVQGVSKKR
jgi:hypothetical protein